MKKTIILTMLLMVGFSFGQSKKTKKLLAEIKNEWTPNQYGVPEYIKTFENLNLTKETLVNNAIKHLKQVSDIDCVITEESETKDQLKIKLTTLVRKDSDYKTYAIYLGSIDFKENRIRIKLTLNKWLGVESNGREYPIPVKESYPFNKIGTDKNYEGKSFYKSHKIILPLINSLAENIIIYKEEPNNTDNW